MAAGYSPAKRLWSPRDRTSPTKASVPPGSGMAEQSRSLTYTRLTEANNGQLNQNGMVRNGSLAGGAQGKGNNAIKKGLDDIPVFTPECAEASIANGIGANSSPGNGRPQVNGRSVGQGSSGFQQHSSQPSSPQAQPYPPSGYPNSQQSHPSTLSPVSHPSHPMSPTHSPYATHVYPHQHPHAGSSPYILDMQPHSPPHPYAPHPHMHVQGPPHPTHWTTGPDGVSIPAYGIPQPPPHALGHGHVHPMEMMHHGYVTHSPPHVSPPRWYPGAAHGPGSGGPPSSSQQSGGMMSIPGSPQSGSYGYQPFDVEPMMSSMMLSPRLGEAGLEMHVNGGGRAHGSGMEAGGPSSVNGSSSKSREPSSQDPPNRPKSTLSSRAIPFAIPTAVVPMSRGPSSISTSMTSPALVSRVSGKSMGMPVANSYNAMPIPNGETYLSPPTSSKDMTNSMMINSPSSRRLPELMTGPPSVSEQPNGGNSSGEATDLEKYGANIWSHDDLPMIKTKIDRDPERTVVTHARGFTSPHLPDLPTMSHSMTEGLLGEIDAAMDLRPIRRPASASARADGHNALHLATMADNPDLGQDTSFDTVSRNEVVRSTTKILEDHTGLEQAQSNASTAAGIDFGGALSHTASPEQLDARWKQAQGALRIVWEQMAKENELLRQSRARLAIEVSRLKLAAATTQSKQAELPTSPETIRKKKIVVKPSSNMPFMQDYPADEVSLQEQAEMRQRPGGTTFAAILLDADYRLFDTSLIKKGAEGGRLAALSLSTAVYELCTASMPPELCPQCFIVQIVINQDAVASRLVKLGHIDQPDVFRNFCAGFSGTHDLFDIVLVKTRESGQAKIREHLRLYMNVDACKLCLLGSSQASAFEELLEGFSAIGLFDKLHLIRSAEQGHVDPFDKFGGPDRVHSVSGMYARAFESEQLMVDFEENGQEGDTATTDRLDELQGLASPAEDGRSGSTKSQVGLATTNANSAAGQTSVYARDGEDFVTVVSRRKKPMDMTLPRSAVSTKLKIVKADEWSKIMEKKKGGKSRRPPASTGGSEGLTSSQRHHRQLSDPDGAFDSADYSNMKQLNPRPCHMEYLVGRCPNRKCNYGHDYELTEGEMAAIRTLAKEMLCPLHAGGRCSKSHDNCIYGHLCPRATHCNFGKDCWFSEVQGPHGVSAASRKYK